VQRKETAVDYTDFVVSPMPSPVFFGAGQLTADGLTERLNVPAGR